jgi:hypothetical protein
MLVSVRRPGSSRSGGIVRRVLLIALLASCASCAANAVRLASPSPRCGTICARTCCKPTACAVMRGRCCCADRDPAGTAPASGFDLAVPEPVVRLFQDHAAGATCPARPALGPDVPRPVPDPPPRTALLLS